MYERHYIEDFPYVSDQVDCERRTPSTDHIYITHLSSQTLTTDSPVTRDIISKI